MGSLDVCVLKTDGINCEEEMAYAFEVAGANPDIVHVNELRDGSRRLDDYGVLGIPGGYSYGDDIASGRVLATELTSYLSDQLQGFVDDQKPILGVCNGFQVLARTRLLPDRSIGLQTATLAGNTSGRFNCRWIDLQVGTSVCKFAQPEDFVIQPLPMHVAHAEGRFMAKEDTIERLKANGQVVFRYASRDGSPATGAPANPNGSTDNIAGICDPTGLILGMMPHPERSIASKHDDRTRTAYAKFAARTIFSNIIDHARNA